MDKIKDGDIALRLGVTPYIGTKTRGKDKGTEETIFHPEHGYLGKDGNATVLEL